MPKQYPGLTWCKDGTERWKKIYRGKIHYFRKYHDETLDASYRRVKHEWEREKVRIDSTDPKIPKSRLSRRELRTSEFARLVLSRLSDLRSVAIGGSEELDEIPQLDRLRQVLDGITEIIHEVDQTRPRRGLMVAHTVDPVASGLPRIVREARDLTRQEIRDLETAQKSPVVSLSLNIRTFLDTKQVRPKTFVNYRRELEVFAQHYGDDDASAIDESTVDGYAAYLKRLVSTAKYSNSSGQRFFHTFREFVKFLHSRRILAELPRNLSSRDLVVKPAPKRVRTIPLDQIQEFIRHTVGRTRLYLLIMLNTGGTFQDVADLRIDEIDFEKGLLTRKRSKMRNVPNAPVVCYKLWDETLELLCKYRSSGSELALVKSDGSPLAYSYLAAGRLRTNNTVQNALQTLKKKLERDGVLTINRPLKEFRHSAASLIASHNEYRQYRQTYLAHTLKSVADQRYIEPTWTHYHEALKWLGEQFGFKTS